VQFLLPELFENDPAGPNYFAHTTEKKVRRGVRGIRRGTSEACESGKEIKAEIGAAILLQINVSFFFLFFKLRVRKATTHM
jgi:hypothetical protein